MHRENAIKSSPVKYLKLRKRNQIFISPKEIFKEINNYFLNVAGNIINELGKWPKINEIGKRIETSFDQFRLIGDKRNCKHVFKLFSNNFNRS